MTLSVFRLKWILTVQKVTEPFSKAIFAEIFFSCGSAPQEVKHLMQAFDKTDLLKTRDGNAIAHF